MKYVKSCLIITMLAGIGYACHGDLDFNGNWNILDIVMMADCILEGNCSYYMDFEAPFPGCDTADMNGDLNYNILDVVILASCVLQDNCGG